MRQVGQFPAFETHEVLNDGKVIRTKFRTVLEAGIELGVWARNKSGVALTTGAVVRLSGRIYGYWI